ncbi:MAG: DinB family protein [Isosphaeraceae bacterium]|nr:DinB family protein [Isosphaeraceae bacterium]
MKDDFASLFAYNRWADRRVLDACRKLTDEQYIAEPAPGWSSVRSSIVHIAVVTEGWIRALSGEAVPSFPTEAEVPTVGDAERLLDRAQRLLDDLLPTLTPERLATPQTLRGGSRTAILPPWAVLRHVVNHSTYHRGQVASKLKRLGVEPPTTDFVYWMFEQMPQQA